MRLLSLSKKNAIFILILTSALVFISLVNNKLEGVNKNPQTSTSFYVLREQEGRNEHVHLNPTGQIQFFQTTDGLIAQYKEGQLNKEQQANINNELSNILTNKPETFYLLPSSTPEEPELIRETDSLMIEINKEGKLQLIYSSHLGEAPKQVQLFYEQLNNIMKNLQEVAYDRLIYAVNLDKIPLRERLYRYTNDIKEAGPLETKLLKTRGVVFTTIHEKNISKYPAAKNAMKKLNWAFKIKDTETNEVKSIGLNPNKPFYVAYKGNHFRVQIYTKFKK